ncbi:MAG: ribosomal protein S18-alanine N-acetyltransferase [Christensenellales bacterium]|jgi:ribosomal-protein-alanine N-acetyltransferase
MNIIKLRVEHLNALYNLENECFLDNAWEKEMLRNEILKKNNINLGLIENKTLIGYLIALNLGEEIEILKIGVDSQCRNRGVAKRLITSFLDSAKKNGIQKVFLEVSEDNISAKKLYEYFGFKKIYNRKDYYKNGLSADICALEI